MAKKLWFFIGIFVVIVAIIVVFTVAKENKSSKAVSGTIKTIAPNNSAGSANNTPNSGTAVTNPEKIPSANQPNTGNSLIAPYGSFVSNHKPGQNGSDLTELSQCITTPGATCYIKFTQNGIVKTLPAQSAGSDGKTFWEWKINDAGLTSGQWTITAVTTLNNQTKTTTDQLTLEIQ